MTRNSKFKMTPVAAAVTSALLIGATDSPAVAQNVLEEIVVKGIRSSLTQSMDHKRNAEGVVDAINAEDIGKFPNTNLAESLQRIPGVSIDRVNGEGSQITVRGFGPSFNQVTLNGRTMPTADVPEVGGGTDGRNTSGFSRAFDFSNLASDGIQALEVYKTGRADLPSGGIGATVNVVTRRPLDSGAGFSAALSAKAINDTSVDRGDDFTPQVGGQFSWVNDDETFGIGVIGSYAERDSAAPSITAAQWDIIPYRTFLGLTTPATVITNAPTDLDALVATSRDSRYHFSEFNSERLNGQLVAQFAPSDTLRMTLDYTFAVNEGEEARSDVSNWFNRPFSDVVFDDSPVQTAIFTRELAGNKGAAMQQTTRATKDELSSIGFNVEFDVSDSLRLTFDGHSSTSEVSPNGPMGFTRINVGTDQRYAPPAGSVSHAVDFSGDAPVQIIEIAPSAATSGLTEDELARLVVAESRVASAVANLRTITQENEIDQFDLKADWDLDGNSRLVVGANYRAQDNLTDDLNHRQILGNWSGENPNDVETYAPGVLSTYCVSCRFEDHTIGGAALTGGTNPNVYGVRGDAAAVFSALSPVYAAAAGFDGIPGNADDAREMAVTSDNVDRLEEDVFSLYVQFSTEFQVADRDARMNVGMRYEDTDLTSTTSSLPTERIDWQGNNDFATFASTSSEGSSIDFSYDNFLPNVDFALDVTDEIVARASYSKTIARATYNNLRASAGVNPPTGPTAYNNKATANAGNPRLLPLESDNYDVSFEWYFDESSYVSLGWFEKRVRNFVGRETVEENWYGLRDASNGAPGSRSGDAAAILDAVGAEQNEDNLFAATVYVDQNATLAEAQAEFVANQGTDGNIDPAVYTTLETDYDVVPDANDPLYVFDTNKPLNNREASIDGIEFQGQHFFGDTGFGIAGSYTIVNGDVGFDVAGDPNESQFALTGLSDTANLTLIYENYGFAARLAYNWRDEFLQNTNDGSGFNNPIFVEEYGQLDLSLGYDVTDNLSVSLDAINLNEETSRNYARSVSDIQFLRENGTRYYFGARYRF